MPRRPLRGTKLLQGAEQAGATGLLFGQQANLREDMRCSAVLLEEPYGLLVDNLRCSTPSIAGRTNRPVDALRVDESLRS